MDNEQLTQKIIDSVILKTQDTIKEAAMQAFNEQFTTSLTAALVDSEFYKSLNEDLQAGLENIYKEINSAKSNGSSNAHSHPADTEKIFSEASDQLDQILKTTEQATEDIMLIVEKQLENQSRVTSALQQVRESDCNSEALSELENLQTKLNDDLIIIMTTLSFQDLTGQRIKKIIDALRSVEKIVFELYMSTGLSLKARAKDPDKDVQEIKAASKQKASALKGPQTDVSQGDVDDLLAQLGM